MKIQDIMTKKPSTVTPDTGVVQAARLMKDEDIGVIPVVDGDRVVGIVTDRDIAIRAVAEGRRIDETRVKDVMSTDVKTVKLSGSVEDAMKLMGREQIRRVPVVDDKGHLVGIVSQADVVLEAKDDKHAEDMIEKISSPGGKHSK